MIKTKYPLAKFGLCLRTDRTENFANIENKKFSISLKTGSFQDE